MDGAAKPPASARLQQAWTAYWFPEDSGVRLAVLRIILVTLQLTWFRHLLHVHFRRVNEFDGFVDPQFLVSLFSAVIGEDLLRTTTTLGVFYALWIATGVLSIVGLFTRPAMLVFAVLNLFFISHKYSYGEEHHAQAIYCLAILFIALAPCHRALSIDALIARRRGMADAQPTKSRDTFWPIRLAQWLLCLAYMNAGAAKLAVGGLDWLNGVTLQTHLLQDGIRWDRPAGLWLAKQHTLCVIASIGAVGMELFFPIIMIFRRLAPLFLIGGVMLHVGIFILQAAPFWEFLVLYSMWVPWERLPGLRPDTVKADAGLGLGHASAKLA